MTAFLICTCLPFCCDHAWREAEGADLIKALSLLVGILYPWQLQLPPEGCHILRIRTSTWESDRVGRQTFYPQWHWMLLDAPVSISSWGFAPFVFSDNYMGWLSHVKPSLHPWNGVHLVTHYDVCPATLNLLVFDPFMLLSGTGLWSPWTHCPCWVHSVHLKHCRSIFENPSCVPSQTSFFPAVGLTPYTA